MMTIPSDRVNKKEVNYSDDELLLKEYQDRCYILKTQRNEKILIKTNLIALNVKNEKISKSLLRKKMEYQNLKSDLCQALFKINVSTNKQKILSRQSLDEFLVKRTKLQEQYRKSPFILELEELIIANNSFFEEYKKITHLLESTKKQYKEMMEILFKNFKKTVCEFCDIVVKFKALNH